MEVSMGLQLGEGIQKKILHAGKGGISTFENGTKIIFHYFVKRCDEAGTVMDDSRKGHSTEPMELLTGKQFKLDVWENCLKTMREKEVAEFIVHPQHLSPFPAVMKQLRDFRSGKPHHQQNSHCCGLASANKVGLGYEDLDKLLKSPEPLRFIFDVMSIVPPGDYKKESWAMSDEERKAILPVLREEGNQLYKQGQHKEAAEKYTEALGCLENLLLHEKPNSAEWIDLDTKRLMFLLNFAQCQYQLGEYYQVIEHASSVIDKDDKNVKAFFRRAKAHTECANYEEAKEDFKKAAELDPSLGAMIRKELKNVQRLEKERDVAEKARLEGMFNKTDK